MKSLDRIIEETKSRYWLCFLNGKWIIYRHETPMLEFSGASGGTLALKQLRRLQGIEQEYVR